MSTAPKQQTNIVPHDAESIESAIWNPDFRYFRKHIHRGQTLVISRLNRRGPANWLSTKCVRKEIDFLKYVCWPNIYRYRYWRVPTLNCSSRELALPPGSHQIIGPNYNRLQAQLPADRKAYKLVLVKYLPKGGWQSTHLLNSSHVFEKNLPQAGICVTYWIAPVVSAEVGVLEELEEMAA